MAVLATAMLVLNRHIIAGDFVNFYVGARAAAAGNAALVYDLGWFRALEQQISGIDKQWLYSYPPIMLLLSLPLALFSLTGALVLWTVLGMGACFGVFRRLVGRTDAAFAVIATPAAFFNLYNGQCAYFTTALIGGALILLERRPLAAGVCIGFLACKPQVAILVPVALAVTGRWRAFAAAAATVAVLGGASVALFGSASWSGFIHQMSVERQILAFDKDLPSLMPTVFAALRAFNVPLPICSAVQAVSAILAAAVLVVVWRSPASAEIKYATLPVATFLATPYAWMHDALILVLSAAWLGREGLSTGFRPWERLAVLALLTLPLLTTAVGLSTHVQLGPLALWPILLLLLRRALGAADRAALGAAAQPPSAVA